MSFNDLFSKEAEIKKAAEEANGKEAISAEPKDKEIPKDLQGKVADRKVTVSVICGVKQMDESGRDG